MEKVLQPYDKERMRMAMLKQEESFREQVYELHRLYQIQKMLMDSTGLNQKQQNSKQDKCKNNMMIMEDESTELELTLSLGPPRSRKTVKSDQSGQSTVSSSSTGSSQTRKASPKNMDSKSTGLSGKEDYRQFTWGNTATTGVGNFVQGSGPGPEPGFSNGQQSSNHPAWLFQALSLRLT